MPAVSYYSRLRMANNLLPLVRRAPTLRRVVSVFAGGHEGRLYVDDIPGRTVSMAGGRGHFASAMTLGLEALARQAPEVSFVHNFPGSVETDLIRPESGLMMQPLRWVFKIMFWGRFLSHDECGERHAYLCVSGMYPSKGGDGGVGLDEGLSVARGTDGRMGSGMYSIDGVGESASEAAIKVLQKHRGDGLVDKVWEHLGSEFKRITGSVAVGV